MIGEYIGVYLGTSYEGYTTDVQVSPLDRSCNDFQTVCAHKKHE